MFGILAQPDSVSESLPGPGHSACLLPTPRVDPYRGRSPARMRPSDSPGPRRSRSPAGHGLQVALSRTPDRVERVRVPLAGSARAREPRYCTLAAPRMTGPNRAPTGTARRRHGLPVPPTARRPASVSRALQVARAPGQRTRSLCSLRDASASNKLASDCKRKPLGSQGPAIPGSPPGCVPRKPGCRRPAPTSCTCPDSEEA
jgi:hypothetical protein